MKSIDELETGDIIAIHNNSGILPKGIQYFMKLWAKIHYNKKLDKYYSHTMTVVPPRYGLNCEVAEAVSKGYVIRSPGFNNKPEDVLVFRLKDRLTYPEQLRLYDMAIEMAFGNIEYEILNFFWWMPYILSNGKVDISPKSGKKRKKLFCFETSALLLNAARPVFEVPDKVTTVDLQFDERFEQFSLDI